MKIRKILICIALVAALPVPCLVVSGAEIATGTQTITFGDKNLTQDEIESFHLSTLKLTYEEAVCEYERCSCTKIGRLVANRELPVLRQAKKIMDSCMKASDHNE